MKSTDILTFDNDTALFGDTLLYLLKAKDKTIDFLFLDISAFKTQLESDYKRGRIKKERLQIIHENMLLLVKAVEAFDHAAAEKYAKKIEENCRYSMATRSKWAAIGFAIGAFFVAIILLAITVLSKGLALPLVPLCISIIGGGGLGSIFGEGVAENKAKRQFYPLRKSIFYKDEYPESGRCYSFFADLSYLARVIFRICEKEYSYTKERKIEEIKIVLSTYGENHNINIDDLFIKRLLEMTFNYKEDPFDKVSFVATQLNKVDFIKNCPDFAKLVTQQVVANADNQMSIAI